MASDPRGETDCAHGKHSILLSATVYNQSNLKFSWLITAMSFINRMFNLHNILWLKFESLSEKTLSLVTCLGAAGNN